MFEIEKEACDLREKRSGRVLGFCSWVLRIHRYKDYDTIPKLIWIKIKQIETNDQ